MTVSEIIRVGDKIEIRVAQEVDLALQNHEAVRMYRAAV